MTRHSSLLKSNLENSDDKLRKTIEGAWKARSYDDTFALHYGHFMIAWADAEAELYKVLVHYCGITDAVARAIFSGTRAKGMIDYLKGIIHNAQIPQDRREDLEHIFPQLGAIGTMRDHLAHHASDSYNFAEDEPEKRIISNAERVSRYGKEKANAVSHETLYQMTHDLYAIKNHLNQHWGPWRIGKAFTPWRENDQNDPPTPWLYKSPQPVDSQGRNS